MMMGVAVIGPHALHSLGSAIGTGVSGTFLYGIGALNLVILWGIIKVFRELRGGSIDERELERQLDARGLMTRFFYHRHWSAAGSW